MSLAEQQKMLDLITRESKKMKSLDENLSLEIEQEEDLQIELQKGNEKKKEKNINDPHEELNDAEEKQALLQAVISEAAAAGTPLTPSFIKLLNNMNGNL